MRLSTGLAATSVAALLLFSVAAHAHFQELLPSTDIVPDKGDHKVKLKAVFTASDGRRPDHGYGSAGTIWCARGRR